MVFPRADGSGAFVPWDELSATLERWREQRSFEQAFMLRKPPGLRLRFKTRHAAANLESDLVAWLLQMEQRNLIRSFRFATYEPEVFLFGGGAGMAIAHEHFDFDTRLVLEFERRVRETPREVISATVLNDLFSRLVEDRGELWDIWMRIWHAHGTPELLPAESQLPGSGPGSGPGSVPGFATSSLQELPGESKDLAQEAILGNARIASRLQAALVTRQLDCGPRAWLAYVATFHWNRWGLGPVARVRMLSVMLRALDPHRVSS